MDAAQIAHLLKMLGRGREAFGRVAIFDAGMQVCAGIELVIWGAYRLVKWRYTRLKKCQLANAQAPFAGAGE